MYIEIHALEDYTQTTNATEKAEFIRIWTAPSSDLEGFLAGNTLNHTGGESDD